MKTLAWILLVAVGLMGIEGCRSAPGVLASESDDAKFEPLYQRNCAGCHGNHGVGGAAIALANPVYVGTAGRTTIQHIVADGVRGGMMPGFGKSAGGMLPDSDIVILAHGIETTWGSHQGLRDAAYLPYASHAAGDAGRGAASYQLFCVRCHGATGRGSADNPTLHVGSIVDPSYLALITDQGLRSIVIAGEPGLGMPDWRSDLEGDEARAMTDQEATDVVAWLTSHRSSTPGQPYSQHSNP